MSDNSVKNKRIAKNTVFLYLRMLLVLIVQLYTSRVILNTLGIQNFGIYNVVAGFVTMFGFLNSTLSSSMQRFYNYEGSRNGSKGFRDVYITGVNIQIGLGLLILLLLETFGLWYVNTIMVIPADRLLAANILFQSSCLSLFLVLFQLPYLGAIMAKEHMNYYALVSILEVVLKLVIVLVLPFLPFDKLITYALLYLLISITNALMYFIYSRIKFHELRYRFEFNKSLFKSMLSFSGWNLIGTFAFMLRGQGVNMLLNAFFGPVVNAARGIAFQVNSAISGFSSNIATAFKPQLVNSFAEGHKTRTIQLMLSESKICFMLIGLLVTPVAIEIDYLLHIWLGDKIPNHTALFTILVLIDLLVSTLNTPITHITWATGRIRKFQIYSSVVNLMLLPACWIFLKQGANSYMVFVITIVISCCNQCVCVICANNEIRFGLITYVQKVLVPCFLYIGILPIVPYLIVNILDSSFLRLFIVSLSSVLVAVFLMYFIGLQKTEKELVKKIIKR